MALIGKPVQILKSFSLEERVGWVLISLCIGAFLICEISDLDIWWHLGIGRDILRNAAISRTETYSVAALGQPFHNSHWLYQVLAAAVYGLGGWVGMELLMIAGWVLILGFVHASCARFLPGFPSILLIFVGAMAAVERFTPRPEIVAYLCIAVFYAMLLRRQYVSKVHLAVFFLLQVVWTNSQATFMMGPFLAGCYLLVEAVRKLRGRAGDLVPLSVLTALLLLATLVSPYGAGGWRFAWRIFVQISLSRSELFRHIGEMLPTFGPATRISPAFWACGLLLLAAGVLGVWSLVRTRQVHARHLILLGFGLLTVLARRNMVLMGLIGPPFLAECILLLRPSGIRLPRAAALGVAGLIGLGALYPLSGLNNLVVGTPARVGFGITPSAFPHHLPAFLEKIGFQGRIFNSNDLGGFYLFHSYPQRIPFYDGRWVEVYDPDKLDFIAWERGDWRAWRDLLDRYGVKGILLQHASWEAKALLPKLEAQREWVPVYLDCAASFWMRPGEPGCPPPLPLRSMDELAAQPRRIEDHLNLDTFLLPVQALEMQMQNLEGAARFRWKRILTLEKLGSLQLLTGRTQEARRTLETLLSEKPSNGTALNGLAYLCMMSGELESALQYASRAFEQDPLNPELKDNLHLIQDAIREKQSPR